MNKNKIYQEENTCSSNCLFHFIIRSVTSTNYKENGLREQKYMIQSLHTSVTTLSPHSRKAIAKLSTFSTFSHFAQHWGTLLLYTVITMADQEAISGTPLLLTAIGALPDMEPDDVDVLLGKIRDIDNIRTGEQLVALSKTTLETKLGHNQVYSIADVSAYLKIYDYLFQKKTRRRAKGRLQIGTD